MNRPPSDGADRRPDDAALATTAKAFAHPVRLALLRAMARKPRCCGHLVEDLSACDMALAQSTVSEHLRVLVQAGLVTRTRCGVESYFNVNRDAVEASLADLGALIAPAAATRLKEKA